MQSWIDALVNALDLVALNFVAPKSAYDQESQIIKDLGGRPAYQPGDMLKLYLYSYYNRI